MSDREREDEEDDEDDEESPPPPKAKAKAKAASSPSKSGGPSGPKSGAPKPALVPATTAIAIGIAALALGGAAGWFGQIEKTKAALHAEAAAPAGSGAQSGPCGAWQSKICASAGDLSASCQQARGAADVLLPSTCEVALGSMAETLAKIKAARASCDKLVGKLCQDLPPGSKTCDMVKQRTPTFPRERCDQMLQSYDKVIAELKQMDAQGGMQMGAPQMGSPQRMPAGAMPGAMPRVTMPPGAAPP